ncbi:APC family permease [Kineococcus gynurae]|uniref:APC family permease n=1 Tax=Kineococcus gynurae TaxID=452979 RepID=A0ABV5LW88_9ACTN
MAQPVTNETATGSRPHLQRVLGLPALVFFGLAYMVPLTVFTTYGIVTDSTQGHLPGAYVITLAAMLFTAYSYGRMVAIHPVAGSAYSYAQRGFGGHTGFMVGWSLLLDYLFLPMVNYLVIGIYMADATGIPAPVWVVGSIVLVTLLNVLGVKLLAGVNVALVGIQFVFIAVFVLLSVRHLSGNEVPSLTEPFFTGAEPGLLFGGAAVLALSFLGFDAISTLSEETRDPRRTIPRAIIIATLTGGILYILLSWVSALVFPEWQTFSNVDSASLDVMARVGGDFLTTFFTAAYVAGCFASAMASQAGVSRILFAMGRDGTLPRAFFGRLSRRFGTPVLATLLVGLISCSALFVDLTLAAAVVSFGALVAFSVVNASVVKVYVVDENHRSPADLVRYGLIPAVGLILTLWLWTSLSRTTFTVGLIWVAVGLVYLVLLTRGFRRPAPTLDLREE